METEYLIGKANNSHWLNHKLNQYFGGIFLLIWRLNPIKVITEIMGGIYKIIGFSIYYWPFQFPQSEIN